MKHDWRWCIAVAYIFVAMVVPHAPGSAAVMSYADFLKLPQPPTPHAIAYGTEPLQHVELWKPEGRGPVPVVLLIHGGCWQTSVARADIMRRMAQAFTRRGVAVWNIEYRGVDVPGGGYPGSFDDVAAAADMLHDQAKRLDLDITKVVAIGHSAGGHMALWLAARHNIGRDSALHAKHPLPIVAVISQGGLPDLREARTAAAHACGADTVDRLVGPPTSTRPDPFADTSPVSLAPLGTPQIMISGAGDVIAPPAFAEGYAAKMRARGDRVSATTIPGQGHFELITPGTPAGDAVIEAALQAIGIAKPRRKPRRSR